MFPFTFSTLFFEFLILRGSLFLKITVRFLSTVTDFHPGIFILCRLWEVNGCELPLLFKSVNNTVDCNDVNHQKLFPFPLCFRRLGILWRNEKYNFVKLSS